MEKLVDDKVWKISEEDRGLLGAVAMENSAVKSLSHGCFDLHDIA